MKYYYKDFDTLKTRWTKRRFMQWTQPTGILHVRYAIFRGKTGNDLCIPAYLIMPETLAILPAQD